MSAPPFTAEFKPKDSRPDEPILIGRAQSQARVTIDEAMALRWQLKKAIKAANIALYEERASSKKKT